MVPTYPFILYGTNLPIYPVWYQPTHLPNVLSQVTSFRPLRAWLYREGFARFSGSIFSMDKKDIANTFIHLTNVAIQKTAEGYDPITMHL